MSVVAVVAAADAMLALLAKHTEGHGHAPIQSIGPSVVAPREMLGGGLGTREAPEPVALRELHMKSLHNDDTPC